VATSCCWKYSIKLKPANRVRYAALTPCTAPPAIEITQLTQQLTQILIEERQQLVWATTNRKAVALKAEAKAVLNQVRRDRALPIIEQYQWIAAAAAFANPVPALDLLATAAINAQLVMDLGNCPGLRRWEYQDSAWRRLARARFK
jgi:hypothetical protein